MGKTLHDYYSMQLSDVQRPEQFDALQIFAGNLESTSLEILKRFKNVTSLTVTASYNSKQLSPNVLHFPQLRHLFLKHVDWQPLNRQLDQLQHLRLLSITCDQLEALPDALVQLCHLDELHLKYKRLGPHFDHWHYLDHLPQLRHLALSHITNEVFPWETLLEMTELQELFLSKNNLREFNKRAPDSLPQLRYCFGHSDLEAKYCPKLLNKARKEQTPWATRALWFNLLGRQHAVLDQWAIEAAVLAATDLQPSTFSAIRLHALEYYAQRWGTTNTLHSGATIAVLGTLAIKKPLLRKQLKALSIQYSAKINDTSTHVLLGQRSKGTYFEALEHGLPILTESQVLDYINTHTEQYLVDEQEEELEQLDHLRALLTSGNDENTALAMTLFEQGGFPTPLLTALFYAYLEAQNTPLREQIRRLLRQYGSVGLFDLLKSRQIIFQPYASENSISTKLKKVAKNTQINTLELAQYGYRQYKKGVTYLLEKSPPAEAQRILQDRTNANGLLDLSLLGLSSVPKAVYQATGVQAIDLSYNTSMRTIPVKQLSKLKGLQHLKLKGTYYLESNEKWRSAMRIQFPEVRLEF